jgi:molybdenum cofactor cytidylyltransferase
MPVYILITAAGASSRMRGEDKLLQVIDGQPLLRRQVTRALAASPLVGVTLSPTHPDRLLAIAGLDVEACVLPDASEGMAASLRHAARSARTYEGQWLATAIMVVPADMPDLTVEDFEKVIATHLEKPKAILQGCTSDGIAGHPVLFPRDLWADLLGLTGDQGARPVLARFSSRVVHVILPSKNAITDLDTPEDWAAWRAGRAE